MDPGELGAHLDPQLEVEVGERLVHEERPRATDQGPRQRDALHLPARHLRGTALQQSLDVQQGRDLLRPRPRCRSRTPCGPAAARRCSRTPCAAGRARSSGRPSRGRGRPGCRRSRPGRRGAPMPPSSFSRPAIARRVVVLPAPDGPSTTKNEPSGTSRSTPSRAWTSPNDLRSPCAATVPIRPPALPCSCRRPAGSRRRGAARPGRRPRSARSVASGPGRRPRRRGRRRR